MRPGQRVARLEIWDCIDIENSPLEPYSWKRTVTREGVTSRWKRITSRASRHYKSWGCTVDHVSVPVAVLNDGNLMFNDPPEIRFAGIVVPPPPP